MADWLFGFWLPYQVTAALSALLTALTLRAALVAYTNKRRLLFASLLMAATAAIAATIGTVGTQLPPLSPAFALAGLAACSVMFVLGIERVRVDLEPTPSREELERLLAEGLRGPTLRLNDAEYELAQHHIRVHRAHVGRALNAEELRLLAAIAHRAMKKS